jgi:signal transduction histidine kinase
MFGDFSGGEPWFRGGDTDEVRAVERPVAVLRVILATTGLIAITVDPTQPAVYAAAAYTVLAAYLGVSLLFLGLARRLTKAESEFGVVSHAVDVCVAAALMLFTLGPDSPFFVFLSFPLLAAAYRWGMKETLLTSATAIVLLAVQTILIGPLPANTPPLVEGSLSLNRLIMRGVYLVIAGVLVGYLAEKEKQRRRETTAMALILGRARVDAGFAGTMQALLGAVARLFHSPRAFVVAQERASGRVFLLSAEPERDGQTAVLTSAELDDAGRQTYFFDLPSDSCHASVSGHGGWCSVLGMEADGTRSQTRRWALPEAFVRSHPCHGLLAVSIAPNDAWSGRVLLLNPDVGLDREESVRFAQRLVREISPPLHQVSVLQRLRSRAEAIERARLARELHDGAIQTLASTQMQLDVLARRAATVAPELAGDLLDIQALVRDEGLNLRDLIQSMRIGVLETDSRPLFDEIHQMVDRFDRQTGISARFVSAGESAAVPARTRHEVLRIVHESLVNIRKHSGARHVMVDASIAGRRLKLTIGDDGRGFAFQGRLTQQELDARREGPAVIRERVQVLGGTLTIASDRGHGSRLELVLPVHGES